MANITKFSDTTKIFQILDTVYARAAILLGLLHLAARSFAFFIFAPTELLGIILSIIPVVIAAFIFPLFIKAAITDVIKIKFFSLIGISGLTGIIIANVLLYVLWFIFSSMGNFNSEYWMQSLFLGMIGDLYVTLLYLIVPFIIFYIVGIFVFKDRILIKEKKDTSKKDAIRKRDIEEAEVIETQDEEPQESEHSEEDKKE